MSGSDDIPPSETPLSDTREAMQAAPSVPPDTEPAETEPAETERGQTEPVDDSPHTEPAATEPATSERAAAPDSATTPIDDRSPLSDTLAGAPAKLDDQAEDREQTGASALAGADEQSEDNDAFALDSTSELMVPAEQLSYVPQAPMVTSLKPRIVDSRGGSEVTVFGAGFVAGCSVFMGDEEIVAEVIDGFTLRFVAPTGLGKREIAVQAASGTRTPTTLELSFIPGPAIRAVHPSEGPLEGGVRVRIEGDRFKEGATLSLFGLHAPELLVISEEEAAFTLPSAADGPLEGAIVITNRDGLQGRSEDAFRYKPLFPEVHAVEPNHGWISGGKIVVVRGKDFHPHARVAFGNTETLVRFKSNQQLDVEVPPCESPGVCDIVVLHPDEKEALLEQAFRYEAVPAPPKIIDLIPRNGLCGGGATIRIVGDNFQEDVVVRIGEVTAMRKVISAKLCDIELPPRQTPGPVAIEMVQAGVTVRSEDAFTYESAKAPLIKHVEPRGGPVSGGTRVIIEGENFPPNAMVRFGGEAAKRVVIKNSTLIETEAPPARAASSVDVEVSSPETGPGISKAGYRYETVPAPTISGVAPAKGTIDGGTELSIEGKNFADGVVVLIGDVPAKIRRISGSMLEAYTPEGQDQKMVDVIVKNPDGQKAIQKRAFQFDARYRS